VTAKKVKKVTPKVKRARKLQGQYLGALKSLTGADRAKVKRTAADKGVAEGREAGAVDEEGIGRQPHGQGPEMALDHDGNGTSRRGSCPLNMRRPFAMSVTWLLGLYLGLVPIHSFAMEPKRPGQENSLSRAVFAEGRLWLLSDAGELSRIKEGEKKRIGMDLPEPALDLCLRDGHPEVVTGARQNCNTWTLRKWADSKWTTLAIVPVEKETLVSLVCSSETEILLTTKRLIEVAAYKATLG